MAIAALALALRVLAVLAVGSYRLEHVTYEHGQIAANLVEGRGFTLRWLGAEGPTSQQAPVYPILVAGFYAVFGVGSSTALVALELFQAMLGGVMSAAVVLLAWELAPAHRRIGYCAGLGAAVYPTLVYASTQVQVAVVASMLVVLVLWSAARAARRRSWAGAAGCGILSGLLVLTDPILALVVAVAMLMLTCSANQSRDSRFGPHRSTPKGKVDRFAPPLPKGGLGGYQRSLSGKAYWVAPAARAAVAVCVCTAVVAPWIVRNYMVHGELVPVKSTFGYAFWQGNHPRSFGTDKIPLGAAQPAPTPDDGVEASLSLSLGGACATNHCSPPYVPLTPTLSPKGRGSDCYVGHSPLGQRDSKSATGSGGRLGVHELERRLWQARLQETLYIDDAVLSNERTRQLGRFSEPERSRQLLREAIGYVREEPWRYLRLCGQRLQYFLLFDETNPKSQVAAYRIAHAGLLGLSLAGVWYSRHLACALWPTYLVFGLVTAFHALTIVSARFHIPLEPIQLIWAAALVLPRSQPPAPGSDFSSGLPRV